MADEPTIDLAFIGQAPSARPVGRACLGQPLQRLTNEVASFRDDMRVLTAIFMRLDSSQAMLLSEMREIRQELRAMHAQHQCTAERVRALEER
jgi:hypothetical protein